MEPNQNLSTQLPQLLFNNCTLLTIKRLIWLFHKQICVCVFCCMEGFLKFVGSGKQILIIGQADQVSKITQSIKLGQTQMVITFLLINLIKFRVYKNLSPASNNQPDGFCLRERKRFSVQGFWLNLGHSLTIT